MRVFSLACVLLAAAVFAAKPLQRFSVTDYLGHTWSNELVHFTFSVPTTRPLMLADAAGTPVPCQFSNVVRKQGSTTGSVWTVVSLAPRATATFQLLPGTFAGKTVLQLLEDGNAYLLGNDRLALRIPKWSVAAPTPLPAFSPPIAAVGGPGGAWYGEGKWTNDGDPLLVTAASTTVTERGPLRVTLKQALTFADGKTYTMIITLADRQELALVTEDSDEEAPKAAFRMNMAPGLQPDHLLWWTNFWQEFRVKDTPLDFTQENLVTKLRAGGNWIIKYSQYVGFFKQGGEPLVAFYGLRPSRWSPYTWEGHDHTEIPVTARPGGQVDLTFALDAWNTPLGGGKTQWMPLHREWAVSVGTVKEHYTLDGAQLKMRKQLMQYSEFPLDEVKEFHFDFTTGNPNQPHPFLLVSQDDLKRVREQAQTVPALKAAVAESEAYIARCGDAEKVLNTESSADFYRKKYLGNYLVEVLPQCYLGTDKPVYGKMMAAAVRGMAQEVLDTFLEKPTRGALCVYGPWFSEPVMRFAFNYDLIAGTGLLTPEEEAQMRAVLVFGAYVMAHPDYWNTERGLASFNPNMTSMINLSRGLVALLLNGHPEAEGWLRFSENEMKTEIHDWSSPGGAWLECPGYELASIDGIFLLAQALKNVTGRDYFSDPRFKEMMDHYGNLLTPPDVRFPTAIRKSVVTRTPMVLPSIGDMFSGQITPFNGWMAAATAKSDPAYSARQQWFWQQQDYTLYASCRAKGMTLGITNADLPAAPPTVLSAAYPGFGAIMRTSWTDPKASYVSFRAGYYFAHYHADFNSLVYYAKGAPLCTDFGSMYYPSINAPWQHSTVSFGTDKEQADRSGVRLDQVPETLAFATLPHVIDYAYGHTHGGANQQHYRHLLMIKSPDPLGANYLVLRDATSNGSYADQKFFYNLWCLATDAQVTGNVVHFPGQYGVDLDLHVLSPAKPQITTDKLSWKGEIFPWHIITEEQYLARVAKQGSEEDFVTVLYPRAPGQPAATVSLTEAANAANPAKGPGFIVEHLEGRDLVLLSPGKPATQAGGTNQMLTGEIAFARIAKTGDITLAVLKGVDATARVDAWQVKSSGPTAVCITTTGLTGECSGDAHAAVLTLPTNYGAVTVTLDGKPFAAKRDGAVLTLELPAGLHQFAITRE